MADKTNPLTCKQCGYANEGERVYCHNCGTKLDRSLLPALSEPEETLSKKQKRIKKAVTPSRGFFAGAGKTFIYTILLAVLVAALILIVLPPDNIPPAVSQDSLLDASNITMDLEDKVGSPTQQNITYKQEEINPYLQLAIKAAPSGMLGDEVKFVRAFVNLDEGMIRISTEQTVFGRPIYCTIYYRLVIRNGKLEATVKGGNFGRLQIDPNLMKNLSSIFQKLWDAPPIKSDKKSLEHCQLIEVHKGHVDLVTLPSVNQ